MSWSDIVPRVAGPYALLGFLAYLTYSPALNEVNKTTPPIQYVFIALVIILTVAICLVMIIVTWTLLHPPQKENSSSIIREQTSNSLVKAREDIKDYGAEDRDG